MSTAADGMPARSTHWEDEAPTYDSVMGTDPAMLALYDEILAHLPPSPRLVLDLGTGTGTLLGLIRERHPECRAVGLDPSPSMLEIARRRLGRAGVVLMEGSAHRIDAPDGSFDLVVSNFALHHLTHAEKADCAREVFRVLAPGGSLVFGDQHCRRMGGPSDPEWTEDLLNLLCAKSEHYLRTAGPERMLLQLRMIPRFLTCDGEIPATVDFWVDLLAGAGFTDITVTAAGPEFLLHRVIRAAKHPEAT
ncbi:MAG TPA: class I SAM-dependent methyltransferase [Longimicrobiaceae bacterium]